MTTAYNRGLRKFFGILAILAVSYILHEPVSEYFEDLSPYQYEDFKKKPVNNAAERDVVLRNSTMLFMLSQWNNTPGQACRTEFKENWRLYSLPKGLHVRLLSNDAFYGKVLLPDGSIGKVSMMDVDSTKLYLSFNTTTELYNPAAPQKKYSVFGDCEVLSWKGWRFDMLVDMSDTTYSRTISVPVLDKVTLKDSHGTVVTVPSNGLYKDGTTNGSGLLGIRSYFRDEYQEYGPKQKSLYVDTPEKLSVLEGHSREEIENLIGPASAYVTSSLSGGYAYAYYGQLAVAPTGRDARGNARYELGAFVYYDEAGTAVLCRQAASGWTWDKLKPLKCPEADPGRLPDPGLKASVRKWSRSFAGKTLTYKGPLEFTDNVDVPSDGGGLSNYFEARREKPVNVAIFAVLFLAAALLVASLWRKVPIRSDTLKAILLGVAQVALAYLSLAAYAGLTHSEDMMHPYWVVVLSWCILILVSGRSKRCPHCGRASKNAVEVSCTHSNIVGEDVMPLGLGVYCDSGDGLPTMNGVRTRVEHFATVRKKTQMNVEWDCYREMRCPRCGTIYTVKTRELKETVPGPICYETKTVTTEEYIRIKQLLVDGRVEKELERRHMTETIGKERRRSYDYDRYEPYFKRYEKGDEGALDEYYSKYF